MFVSIHTIDGQKVQQVGRTAVLIQGECAHTQSFTLLHSNGTPILHQNGQPASIQMQYSYSPASRTQHMDKLLPPLEEDKKVRSQSKSISRMARRSGQRSPSPAKNTNASEDTPQISAMLGFFSGTSSDQGLCSNEGLTSPGSSQQGSHGHTEPDVDFEPVNSRVQRSAAPLPTRGTNLDHLCAGEMPEQRLATKSDPNRGDKASSASTSLATSQSSTVSMTLPPDRPSPKMSPRHTPRKSRKGSVQSADKPEKAEASASQKVEVVHIVRQSSKDQPSVKSRVGIGISFGVTRSGEIFITGLSPKGSAKASGKVKEGDQLLAVDGVDIKGYQVKDIVQLILGKPGTKVSLDLIPAAVETPAGLVNDARSASDGKHQEPKQPEVKPPMPVGIPMAFLEPASKDHEVVFYVMLEHIPLIEANWEDSKRDSGAGVCCKHQCA